MIHSIIGLIAFVAIFGGALFGIFAARCLPEHHLSDETRTAVSVSAAIVGTLSALVLGLMISTASSSFSTRSREVTAISVDLIRINRMMQRYGPEADDVRAKLRTYATAIMQKLFPASGKPAQPSEATVRMMETTHEAILSLVPTDETHRWLRSQALTLSDGVLQARWLLAEQAGSSIPLPFLILLIFWLAIVFASFGLFAPLNATAVTALCLCSMAVSAGIVMILELDSPFSGLVRVSAEPMRQALAQIMR
jgi:ABC-type amino acid transport system permease subunit